MLASALVAFCIIVSGRVTDACGPVPHARVTLYASSWGIPLGCPTSYETYTDHDGHYELAVQECALTSPNVIITASEAGHESVDIHFPGAQLVARPLCDVQLPRSVWRIFMPRVWQW